MKRFDIKQRISAFLLKEDGKITKQSVLKAGILLGAIALAGRSVAGDEKGGYNGDCNRIDAKASTCDYHVGGCDQSHTNAMHSNNLDVRNVFGRLILGHDNCVETHSNHADHSSHDEGHVSGQSPCGW